MTEGGFITFYWRDASDYRLPKSVCARYGPKDLCYLRDMLNTPNYHGDIFNAASGRHGLNLCSDEQIRQDFQHLSREEQQNALFCYLPSINFARPRIAKGDDDTRRLVDRYLQWRTQHLAVLVRCLDILHAYLFAARGGTYAIDFGKGTSRLRLSLIMDIHRKSSETSKVVKRSGDAFQEYPKKMKPKSSKTFDQLDAIFDLMIQHGEMLRETYHFEITERAGQTRVTLYNEFRKQHKKSLSTRLWMGGGANYMRSAFDTYALHWFPFNHGEQFVRSPK